MKSPQELNHNRLEQTLAKTLRESGLYKHVYTNVHYAKGIHVGEVDVLALRRDGVNEYYEVKTSPRIKQSEKQYERFKLVFSRPSVGYMASLGIIRRLL